LLDLDDRLRMNLDDMLGLRRLGLDVVQRRAVLLGRAGGAHRHGGRGRRLRRRLEGRLLPLHEQVHREDHEPEQQRPDDPGRDILREGVVRPVSLGGVHGQPGRGTDDEQRKGSLHVKPIGTLV
jgi:hypothetical protein